MNKPMDEWSLLSGSSQPKGQTHKYQDRAACAEHGSYN